MKTIYTFLSSSVLCVALLYSNTTIAAKGGNKPSSPEVDSVTVDRIKQAILVEGSELLDTTFELGGQSVIADPATNSFTHQEINFTALPNVVSTGNYNLVINGVTAFSIYIDGAIVNPSFTGCPCEDDWHQELLIDRTNLSGGACFDIGTEIGGLITDNDNGNTLVIGAVYDAADPAGSVCSLTEIDSSTAVDTILIEFPVNVEQQAACALYIKDNNILTGCP